MELTLTLIPAPDAPAGAPVELLDAPADAPHVAVTDLGVNRGDGVFEVAGCLGGRIQALDAHLARLARSASLLDLPAPNLDLFAAAAQSCVARLTATRPDDELLCKLVYTRGPEIGPGGPFAWAMAYPSPDFAQVRADGIDVVTLDRGLASTVTATSPWLLAGAKTLSYAVNKAALREAARRGASDVLFVSTDGQVLEAPSSTCVLRLDGVLTTPPESVGILAGTTQADLFAWASGRGLATAVRPVGADELDRADAAWFTSSGRLAVPVRSLDGRPLAVDAELTRAANAFLGARGATRPRTPDDPRDS